MANRSVNSEYVLHPKEETVSAAVCMTIILFIFIQLENNSIVADLKLVIFVSLDILYLVSEIFFLLLFLLFLLLLLCGTSLGKRGLKKCNTSSQICTSKTNKATP